MGYRTEPELAKAWRKDRIEKGLCVSCAPGVALPGKRYCAACDEKIREVDRKRRLARGAVPADKPRKCGRCQELGHNAHTCVNEPVAPPPPKPRGKPGPKPKATIKKRKRDSSKSKRDAKEKKIRASRFSEEHQSIHEVLADDD